MKRSMLILTVVMAISTMAYGLSDDFEDGVIDTSLWVIGGAKRSYLQMPAGSWDCSHEEIMDTDGYLRTRVWGPTSGVTYGHDAWIRTKHDFNDGKSYLVNFTWEAEVVGEGWVDFYFIQVTDGYTPQNANYNWPIVNPPVGTTDLLWHDSGGNPVNCWTLLGGMAKTSMSIKITPDGTAKLYDGPNGSGNLLHQGSLNPNVEWYIRFMVSDATSAGHPGGDSRINLYDFSVVSKPTYEWHTYNGHQYAVTKDYCNWADAEAEAVSVGGHLVTINDAAENAWLTETFGGYDDAGHHGVWAHLLWIGFEHTGGDMSNPSNWQWVSGQPVTYIGTWYDGSPVGPPGGGPHAYLHPSTHPIPGTWFNAAGRDTNPVSYPHGIIEIGEPVCSFSDDFEDGVIDTNLWFIGGRRISWTSSHEGSWIWSNDEIVDQVDGYLRARVQGPTSGNSYGAVAWVRTVDNFNDGTDYTLNFTWKADVDDDNLNAYNIQVTDGYIPSFEEFHGWEFRQSLEGATDLLWGTDSEGTFPGRRYEFDSEKQMWSIIISASAVARLYDGPNATGSLLREATLDPAKPWYVRFMVSDATSAGFPAGDNRLNLYDFSATCESDVHNSNAWKTNIAPALLDYSNATAGSTLAGSILAIAGLLAPEPISTAAGGVALFKQTSSIVLGYFLRKIIADPPDANYDEVYIPQIPSIYIEGLGGLSPEHAAIFQRTIDLRAKLVAYLKALLITMEREAGAREVGDQAWLEIQQDAFGRYSKVVQSLIAEIIPAEEAANSVLVELGITSDPLELSDIENFQQYLANHGLPVDELYILSLFGIEPNDVQEQIDAWIAIDPCELVGATVQDVFSEAEMFEQFLGIFPEAENYMPIADAGGPYIAQASSWLGASVVLDGTASSDPDGDTMTYEWDLDVSQDSDGDGNPNNDVDANQPISEVIFPVGQTEISLVVADEYGLRSEPDVTTVTVSFIEVGIDIKPGSFPNAINLGSHGVIPVAFLTDEGFDASTIDPATVTLRGEDFSDGLVKLRGKKDAPVPMSNLEDVDDDGDLDLVVHLVTEKLAAYGLDAVCELGALTYDSYVVSGSDTIQIVSE